MKKTLIVLLLTACLASTAFSQVQLSGWGRAAWIPFFLDSTTEEWRSTTHATYGGEPDIEFFFSAASENIGVDVGLLVMPANLIQAGDAKIWWRPNPGFRLHVGMGRLGTLRGKVAGSTGGYSYARGALTGLTGGANAPILKVDDGDGIFSRFNLSKMGAILEITPQAVPGLFIGAAFAPDFTPANGTAAKDVYRGLHVAAGYEINNGGLLRFGFIGGGADEHGAIGNAGQNWDFSWDKRIEAAFALTSLPDLLIDFGFKFSLEKHPGILAASGFSLENPLYLALGVMYTGVEKLKLGFALDGHFAGTAKSDEDHTASPFEHTAVSSAPQIAFNIYPSYDIGFCEVGADITFGIQLGDEEGANDRKMLGFGVYGQKQYGNGNIRIGVYANAPMNEGQNWGMSLPIWLTYSFF